MKFYLGTHEPSWLWDERVDVPLFIAWQRLRRKANLRPSTVPWALDSGGFTQLSRNGRWDKSAREYVADVARYQRLIGGLQWAAPQDWMCEPWVIHGERGCPGTGKSVAEHQQLTVWNYFRLVELWPEYSDAECPFIPVLQGWTLGDYRYCADMYEAAGVNLRAQKAVGLGSVCRRSSGAGTLRIMSIALMLSEYPLHGFGVKLDGLPAFGRYLASADSLSWSLDAYRADGPKLDDCTHKRCQNCMRYAMAWRDRLIASQVDWAA